jgi:hypothetical protein
VEAALCKPLSEPLTAKLTSPFVELEDRGAEPLEPWTEHSHSLKLNRGFRKWSLAPGKRVQPALTFRVLALKELHPSVSSNAETAQLSLRRRVTANDLAHPVEERAVGKITEGRRHWQRGQLAKLPIRSTRNL